MFRFVIPPQSYSLMGLTLACCLLASCNGAGLSDADGDNVGTDNPSPVPEVPVDPEPPVDTEPPVDPESPVDPTEPVGECVVSNNPSDAGDTELRLALLDLQGHLDGTATLSDQQIEETSDAYALHGEQLTSHPSLIALAFDNIELYDEAFGPLFLNESTAGSVPRQSTNAANAIHYAMITLQQSVIDHAYTNRNVRRYRSALENRGFQSTLIITWHHEPLQFRAFLYLHQANGSGIRTACECRRTGIRTNCGISAASIVNHSQSAQFRTSSASVFDLPCIYFY